MAVGSNFVASAADARYGREIVRISDAVMVARGDLGVEFPPENVPVLQRRVINSAKYHRRPVIVATEPTFEDVARPMR